METRLILGTVRRHEQNATDLLAERDRLFDGGGDHGGVTRPHQCQAHVAEALFAPQADNGFGLRIELHTVLAKVLAGQLAAQVEQAIGLAIAMIPLVVGRFDHFLHHNPLGRIGGIAHAQIDNVSTARPRTSLQPVDFSEHIRRQALDAMKLFGQFSVLSKLAVQSRG